MLVGLLRPFLLDSEGRQLALLNSNASTDSVLFDHLSKEASSGPEPAILEWYGHSVRF